MKKILLKTVVSIFALLLFSSNLAQASNRDLTFNGSGWGHGVGLSQYGARGMVLEGYGHKEILAHYFPGTEVTNLSSVSRGLSLLETEKPLMVGLLQNQRELVFRIESSSAQMCFEDKDLCVATGLEGQQWKVSFTEDDKCQFQRKAGIGGGYVNFEPTGSCNVSVRPTSESTIIYVPLKGRSYKNGRLMGKVSPISGRLNLSLKTDVEQYISGVQELPDNWSMEVLKAQAIASRTLAVYQLIEQGSVKDFSDQRIGLCNCHVLDDEDEQKFNGYTPETRHKNWKESVSATARQVITFNNEVIRTRFSTSTWGRTEDNRTAGGSYYPYLLDVDDSFSFVKGISNPFVSWSLRYDQSELASRFGFQWLSNAAVVSRNKSGSVNEVNLYGIISGRPDSVVATGLQIRDALGLHSSFFNIAVARRFSDVSVDYAFAGEILGLSELGVTTGCTTVSYCPTKPVTRGEMAAFLVRALKLTPKDSEKNVFIDDDGSIFETEIETLYTNGVTTGCTTVSYCPTRPVTRGEMAAFLIRGMSLID